MFGSHHENMPHMLNMMTRLMDHYAYDYRYYDDNHVIMLQNMLEVCLHFASYVPDKRSVSLASIIYMNGMSWRCSAADECISTISTIIDSDRSIGAALLSLMDMVNIFHNSYDRKVLDILSVFNDKHAVKSHVMEICSELIRLHSLYIQGIPVDCPMQSFCTQYGDDTHKHHE